MMTTTITRGNLRTEWMAVEGFVLRHWALTRRYLAWEAVFLVYTVVNTLTIGLIGSASRDPSLTLYLVVGGVLWGFLSVLFHEVSQCIAYERWEGTLEYTFMAPIHRVTHLAGMCAYAVIYGTVRSVAVLGAVAVFFDLDLSRADWVSAAAVLAASSLSFVGLGLVGATLPVLSPEKGPQAGHILQAGLLLVSGVYYDTAALPGWLQPLSRVSPATYTLRAMRGALMEGAGVGSLAGDLALLVAAGLVLVPAGLQVFLAAERHAMRTGILKRNG